MLKEKLTGMKRDAFIIAVALFFFSFFTSFRAEAWSVNPSDYRYDMSLYFSVSSLEYENLDLYEIGAFIGDECRGIAEKLDLPDGSSCLYMRIRSNSVSGDEVEFKALDKLTDDITILSGAKDEKIFFKPDQMIGLPSSPYMLYPRQPGNNIFSAIFTIDGEEISVISVEYGTEISVPEAPVKEGYSFFGWEGIPETMPNHDIEITGYYIINKYKAIFKIDDSVVAQLDVEYNSSVNAPSAPEKDGYTFTGWQNVPETMPPFDIEILGVYQVKTFTATFMVDDAVVAAIPVDYGAEILQPVAPVREGYSFAGWSEVPATMPAHDIKIEGNYIKNNYKATFIIDGEVIEVKEVEYDSPTIEAPAAPQKEGYTFTGWQNIPETMPAFDVEIAGTYTINTYLATFLINDEVIADILFDYGARIVAPDAPAKQGYKFDGWQDIPETMPAKNLEIFGSYSADSSSDPVASTYNVNFMIGDVPVAIIPFQAGSEIKAPVAPEREGYTFAGWQNVPETMPEEDITIYGTYTINRYKAVFKIGETVIEEIEVDYNSVVEVPEAPAKEGYSFMGWQNVPETMPPFDVEILGAYDVIAYNIVFMIDGDIVATQEFDFGEAVIAPEAPTKEGYSFSGWTDLPEAMPAENLTVTGRYIINKYKAIFKIDDEIVVNMEVDYNSVITAPVPPEKEGYTFTGWQNIPETMPPFEVEILGTYAVNTYSVIFKIEEDVIAEFKMDYGAEIIAPEAPAKEGYIFAGWENMPKTMPAADITVVGKYEADTSTAVTSIASQEESLTVFNLNGAMVCKNVSFSDLNGRLAPGIYIINHKKVIVK